MIIEIWQFLRNLKSFVPKRNLVPPLKDHFMDNPAFRNVAKEAGNSTWKPGRLGKILEKKEGWRTQSEELRMLSLFTTLFRTKYNLFNSHFCPWLKNYIWNKENDFNPWIKDFAQDKKNFLKPNHFVLDKPNFFPNQK